MIQRNLHGTEGFFDIGKIHHPSAQRIHGTGYFDLAFETVAVDAPAFVSRRNIGKKMRGFEPERFVKFHQAGVIHGRGI